MHPCPAWEGSSPPKPAGLAPSPKNTFTLSLPPILPLGAPLRKSSPPRKPLSLQDLTSPLSPRPSPLKQGKLGLKLGLCLLYPRGCGEGPCLGASQEVKHEVHLLFSGPPNPGARPLDPGSPDPLQDLCPRSWKWLKSALQDSSGTRARFQRFGSQQALFCPVGEGAEGRGS